MSEFLDEESQQMDEQEFKVEKELGEGISIHDSINTLSLRKMVLVKNDGYGKWNSIQISIEFSPGIDLMWTGAGKGFSAIY